MAGDPEYAIARQLLDLGEAVVRLREEARLSRSELGKRLRVKARDIAILEEETPTRTCWTIGGSAQPPGSDAHTEYANASRSVDIASHDPTSQASARASLSSTAPGPAVLYQIGKLQITKLLAEAPPRTQYPIARNRSRSRATIAASEFSARGTVTPPKLPASTNDVELNRRFRGPFGGRCRR